MISQRSESLKVRPKIHDYGCYFLSIAMMGWEYSEPEKEISSDNIIKAYDEMIRKSYMREDCYILNPQKMIDYWKAGLRFIGRKEAYYELEENETEIELWKLRRPKPKTWWYHFVYKSFDPWKRSKTRAEGELDSYRVFKGGK